jgi:hypothetical protein
MVSMIVMVSVIVMVSMIVMVSAIVMVSMISPSGVDRVFEPHSGKTKNYQIGIYCFSELHTMK